VIERAIARTLSKTNYSVASTSYLGSTHNIEYQEETEKELIGGQRSYISWDRKCETKGEITLKIGTMPKALRGGRTKSALENDAGIIVLSLPQDAFGTARRPIKSHSCGQKKRRAKGKTLEKMSLWREEAGDRLVRTASIPLAQTRAKNAPEKRREGVYQSGILHDSRDAFQGLSLLCHVRDPFSLESEERGDVPSARVYKTKRGVCRTPLPKLP